MPAITPPLTAAATTDFLLEELQSTPCAFLSKQMHTEPFSHWPSPLQLFGHDSAIYGGEMSRHTRSKLLGDDHVRTYMTVEAVQARAGAEHCAAGPQPNTPAPLWHQAQSSAGSSTELMQLPQSVRSAQTGGTVDSEQSGPV